MTIHPPVQPCRSKSWQSIRSPSSGTCITAQLALFADTVFLFGGQDALEALGEEDAVCLQEQLAGGGAGKLQGGEGQVFEVTPAMVEINRVQKKVAGRCVSVLCSVWAK